MRKISLKKSTRSRIKAKKNAIIKRFDTISVLKNTFLIKPSKKWFSVLKKFFLNIRKIGVRFFQFFGAVRAAIKRNKLLSNEYFIRIVIICFFFGLNVQLLPYFLKTTQVKLPEEILVVLDSLGVIDKETFNESYPPRNSVAEEPSLDPQILFEKLNDERKLREREPFTYSDRLASAAAELLQESEKYEYEIQDKPFTDELKKALKNQGYNFEHVSHNVVIGPLLEDAVIDAWLSNEQQIAALFEDDFKEVGMSTKIIKTKYNETLGVTVQILGLEFPKRSFSAQSTTTAQSKTNASYQFPSISNEEVFDALNSYRQSHGVDNLNINGELCTYAEKRVQDLIAFGSLDNHEGFKRDFANPESVPQAIREYPGSQIAENLAYQSCKNMTTGDSFIAQTGTALIEWCFDSSTMGHKEAQLSRDFRDVCVRNAQGMFVVIFGGN